MSNRKQEIFAYLERAEQSILAADELFNRGFYDFAASRAYYAAFYAAIAILLNERLEFSKHSGVIAAIHQRFVKAGKLSKEHGKNLNWLFEIRNIADYGGMLHISQSQAKQAISAANTFLQTVMSLLKE